MGGSMLHGPAGACMFDDDRQRLRRLTDKTVDDYGSVFDSAILCRWLGVASSTNYRPPQPVNSPARSDDDSHLAGRLHERPNAVARNAACVRVHFVCLRFQRRSIRRRCERIAFRRRGSPTSAIAARRQFPCRYNCQRGTARQRVSWPANSTSVDHSGTDVQSRAVEQRVRQTPLS